MKNVLYKETIYIYKTTYLKFIKMLSFIEYHY